MTAKSYLRGTSYVLGEREVGYASIPGLPELAAAFGLASNPGLWGWGAVRITQNGGTWRGSHRLGRIAN